MCEGPLLSSCLNVLVRLSSLRSCNTESAGYGVLLSRSDGLPSLGQPESLRGRSVLGEDSTTAAGAEFSSILIYILWPGGTHVRNTSASHVHQMESFFPRPFRMMSGIYGYVMFMPVKPRIIFLSLCVPFGS